MGRWRGSPAFVGGGLLMDAGVHRLYLALYFFGQVSRVHAVLDAPRERGEAFAVAVLEFRSGALGPIEANHLHRIYGSAVIPQEIPNVDN